MIKSPELDSPRKFVKFPFFIMFKQKETLNNGKPNNINYQDIKA